jgi:hypothetical protein
MYAIPDKMGAKYFDSEKTAQNLAVGVFLFKTMLKQAFTEGNR